MYIHSTNNLTPSYLLPQVADFEAAGGKDGLTEHVRRAFVDTIVHEILHALYFSDWLYDFFVDNASQPVGKKSRGGNGLAGAPGYQNASNSRKSNRALQLHLPYQCTIGERG